MKSVVQYVSMRMLFLIFVLCVTVMSDTAMAQDRQKPPFLSNLLWWPGEHWGEDLFKPYADPPNVMHNQQWADDPFTPHDWISAYKSPQDMMYAFQRADIIVAQDKDDGIPQFIAGGGYKDLSPRDRRRLAATLDSVYGYTRKEPYAFRIVDKHSDEVLGLYTRQGFQSH